MSQSNNFYRKYYFISVSNIIVMAPESFGMNVAVHAFSLW